MTNDENQDDSSPEIYDLPFGMSQIRKWKWTRYLPFSPTFKGVGNEDEETSSTVSTQTVTISSTQTLSTN